MDQTLQESQKVVEIKQTQSVSPETQMEKVILGSGCFWCTESTLSQFLGKGGIQKLVPVYAGGPRVINAETKLEVTPTYKDICTGQTGHAEAVLVEFDPNHISFINILDLFFGIHDPTQRDRQGPDVGTQYRSVIFPMTQSQSEAVEEYIKILKSSSGLDIQTSVEKYSTCYVAEEYHHNYFVKNPTNSYCRNTINPKLKMMRKKLATLYSKLLT